MLKLTLGLVGFLSGRVPEEKKLIASVSTRRVGEPAGQLFYIDCSGARFFCLHIYEVTPLTKAIPGTKIQIQGGYIL